MKRRRVEEKPISALQKGEEEASSAPAPCSLNLPLFLKNGSHFEGGNARAVAKNSSSSTNSSSQEVLNGPF